MEFLNNAMEIEIYTRRKCKRFPKTERFTTSARLIGLAAEAAGHLSRGNDIYPATQHDAQKRHIKSTVIGERVVQRCLCDYALLPDDVYNSFQSWSSHSRRFDAWRTRENMKALYTQLFISEGGTDHEHHLHQGPGR